MIFRTFVILTTSFLLAACSIYKSDARKALEADGIALAGLSKTTKKLTVEELNLLSAEFCFVSEEAFSTVLKLRPQRLSSIASGDLSWFQWVTESGQQKDLRFTYLNFSTQLVKQCIFSLERSWTDEDFRWAESISWNFVHEQEPPQ